MGERATLAKARKELEEMYLGIPDDSVNLTFQDLAQVRQKSIEKKKSSSPSSSIEPISESSPKKPEKIPSHLTKIPSLDFSKGLEASFQSSNTHHLNFDYQNHHNPNNHHKSDMRSPRGFTYVHDHHLGNSHGMDHGHHNHHGSLHGGDHGHHNHHGSLHGGDHGHHHHHNHHHGSMHGTDHGTGPMMHDQMSHAYDDMSHVSGMSVAYGLRRGRRPRPGIPHSNICAVCCNYIYLFRHRCLVCGRVYCRQCVSIGMGEMTEGRKCIDCLGRRFSQRYIKKAGNVGCCMGYPSTVKQQELKWAEKGPRRSGDYQNRYGHSVMVSRSRSPTVPGTPNRHLTPPSTPPSFVMNSPYSASNHHPLPF